MAPNMFGLWVCGGPRASLRVKLIYININIGTMFGRTHNIIFGRTRFEYSVAVTFGRTLLRIC